MVFSLMVFNGVSWCLMVFNGTKTSDSMDYEWDIPSGVIKHGWQWKIPDLNEGFIRRITDKWSIFHCHVEYWRVVCAVLGNP